MKIYDFGNRVILCIPIAVFSVATFVNWLKADVPYWPLLLHEKGFIWAEIPPVIFYKMALVGLLDVGASTLLFLLNYHIGKKYKLTRSFTVFLLTSLLVSVSLGFLTGYVAKQIEMSQYSIINIQILYYIPSELGSKIVWCMLGVLIGNYRTETKSA